MLLYRYTIRVTPDGAKVPDFSPGSEPSTAVVKLTIVTSFYRKSVDSGYQRLVAQLADEGVFDDYIAALVMSLVTTGEIASHPLPEYDCTFRRTKQGISTRNSESCYKFWSGQILHKAVGVSMPMVGHSVRSSTDFISHDPFLRFILLTADVMKPYFRLINYKTKSLCFYASI